MLELVSFSVEFVTRTAVHIPWSCLCVFHVLHSDYHYVLKECWLLWTDRVTRMGETRNAYRVLMGKPLTCMWN